MSRIPAIPSPLEPSRIAIKRKSSNKVTEAVPTVPHTPCFTAGTEIATDCGMMCIEEIRVGDRILTRDNGYRRVRWIGARRFDADALAQFPDLRPVRISASSIAAGVPERDLVVSPQHRLLLTGAEALELGGETEILVAALDLASRLQADQPEIDDVIYFHILFDAHEIVWANGCWSESFLPASEALDGLHSAQRDEILTIFPELATKGGQARYPAARAGILREQPQLTLAA